MNFRNTALINRVKHGGLTMKKLWLILSLLIIGCSKSQLPLAPEPLSTLLVTAIQSNGESIDSAQVYLDGKLAGNTPYKNEEVQSGFHALRVMKEGFQFYTEQIFIEKGQSHNIEAILVPIPSSEGELVITINQDSAVVMVKDVNENIVVQTEERESSHLLPAGPYFVSGEKEKFPKVVKAVEVIAGEATVVNLELFPPESEAPSLVFRIAEDTVQLGESINLSWQSNGYQVIIDQGIGVRGPIGSEKIVCSAPGLKVFTATAYGENNFTTERKDSVYIVTKTTTPPSLDFSVILDTVQFSEPVPIQWQSDGYQVVIDQGVGVRGPIGYEEVYFANPGKKVFTATAFGEENLITIRQDSVFVKEAPEPILPVIVLSTTKLITVDSIATISWYSQNADYVIVDYVDNADLQGSIEISFSSPGIRIVSATAINQAGYVSAADTIEVVEPNVNAVNDIIVPAQVGVRADRGESGYVDKNAATINVEIPGKYRIFAEVWYNSGDSQLNESYYLLDRDELGQVRAPQNPNAGIYKVVPDEPGEPHTASQESGIFYLTAETHVIEVYHYAKIANIYPQFLNGPIDGPESVKILGFKLVYVSE